MDLPPLRHPVLAPGVRVLRRGVDEVQVGLDPRRALTLRGTGVVRRTLAVVTQGGCTADADPGLLSALHQRGLVTEHPAGGAEPALRALRVVALDTEPPGADLVKAAGLRVAEGEELPEAGLVVASGEPDRAVLDPWVFARLPHLLVRFVEGDALVGPFVDPGRTACLRCLDAHHTDDDPRWPLLVAQQAAAVGDTVDPLLRSIALSWALADLRSHLAGQRAATWSATLRLSVHLVEAESVAWRRHPECGCTDRLPTVST